MKASTALYKISCSFLINWALAKSKEVIFFCIVKSLVKSINVCSSFIEPVNGSTSVTAVLWPLWSVSLFVFSKLFDPLKLTEGLYSAFEIFISSSDTLIFSLSAFSWMLLL